jgi:UPF0716 family protein affecting phage T7 exclusion
MTPERFGVGWLFWVAGWTLLVGSVLFVAPAYVALGSSVALWVASVVGVLTVGLVWLGAEAGRALNRNHGHVRVSGGRAVTSRQG